MRRGRRLIQTVRGNALNITSKVGSVMPKDRRQAVPMCKSIGTDAALNAETILGTDAALASSSAVNASVPHTQSLVGIKGNAEG